MGNSADPQKVYSTGQTEYDFVQLAKLASYIPKQRMDSLTDGGAMVPPVLVNPDYIPPNAGPALMAINATTCAIAVAAVFIRLYYAYFRSRSQHLLAEDYLMVLAALMTVAMTILNCYGAAMLQWGMLYTDLTIKSLEATSIILFSYQYTVAYNMTLIRISIVLFFRRLYLQAGSKAVWYCNSIIFISCCVVISTTFVSTFNCNPVQGGWNLWVRYETHGCGADGSGLSGGIIQIFLDMAVVAVPIRLIVTLSCSWKRKLQMFALLAVGSLCWIAALLRLLYIRDSAAFEWDKVTKAILCSQFEATIAITCACVPMLKSLWVSSCDNSSDEDLHSRVVRSVRINRCCHLDDKFSKDMSSVTTYAVETRTKSREFAGGVLSIRAMKGTTPTFSPLHSPMSELQQLRKPEPAVVVSHASGGEDYYEDLNFGEMDFAAGGTMSRSFTPDYEYRGRRPEVDDSSRLAVRSRDPSIGSSYGRSSRESTYSNICDDAPMSGLSFARRSSILTGSMASPR